MDTNVLVYATVAEAPLYTVARESLDAFTAQGTDLWISRQVLREYLAVLSRPQTFSQPIPAITLTQSVRVFESRFRTAEDNALVTAKLLDLLLQFPSGGKQVHDANIVATMLVYGVPTLLTHNTADFARFAGVVEVLPLSAQ